MVRQSPLTTAFFPTIMLPLIVLIEPLRMLFSATKTDWFILTRHAGISRAGIRSHTGNEFLDSIALPPRMINMV